MKTPKPPDPYDTAAAQGGMNRDTAITQQQLNMVNQVNPWGTVGYEQTGTGGFTDSQGNWVETPTYTQTTTYTPEQQAIFDATQAAQGNLSNIANEQSAFLRDYLNEPFSYNVGDHEAWAGGLYDQINTPGLAQQQSSLEARLAAQGVKPGSAAYDNAMRNVMSAQGTARNQFMLDSYQTGMNSAMMHRNQPLNEIIGLMNGTQLQNPGSASPAAPQTGVAGVDYTGLVNNQYNAQVASQGAMMGGLFGLGGSLGAAAIMSDRRLKTDITRVGTTEGGTPIYTYRYVWGGPVHMGVMAQDVPEAAADMGNGYLGVDYSKVA